MAAATPTGALVALHHVSFRFDDGIALFDSLDLSIDRTPTGIVGRNGAGKRLLAQLIAGRRTPLLDAPTDHLDLESVRATEAALAGLPGAIVVASPDAAFLAALEPTHTMQWQRDGWRHEPVA